jgi:E3 ubiquitin-protein ligase TRIP12
LVPLLQALTNNSVSVFEMVTSGAVSQLTQYLQGKDLPEGSHKDEQLLCRLRNFTSIALAAHDQQPPGEAATAAYGAASGGAAAAAAAAASSVPLTALVRKLQGALASAEAFPVLCSPLASSGASFGSTGRSLGRSAGLSGSFNRSTLSSGLQALTQPFRLKLVRHEQVRSEQWRGAWVHMLRHSIYWV